MGPLLPRYKWSYPISRVISPQLPIHVQPFIWVLSPFVYHLERIDGDRHSHVLVYHSPLQIVTFWEWLCAIYFHYGVTISTWMSRWKWMDQW